MSHAFATSKALEGFAFDELSDEAKARARDWWRSCDVCDDTWYEAVQSDAIEVWKLFGFDVDPKQAFFALSYSQGDGASFAGDYQAPEKSVVEAIAEYAPEDQVLKALAERIDVLQTTARLRWDSTWVAKIIRRGLYDHSPAMISVGVMLTADDEPGDSESRPHADAEIEAIARSLADWYFENLKEEDEYLSSDEVVDEALRGDYRFDELGHII